MDLVFWLAVPGAALLIFECLVVSLTDTRSGCFVLPAIAAVCFVFTLLGAASTTAWDSLGWGILSMVAGSGLLGCLLGGGIGFALRKMRQRKGACRHEADEAL